MVDVRRRRMLLIFISFITTFLIMRTILFFYPNADLIIGGFGVHHLFVGILLIAISGPPLIALRDYWGWIDIAALMFGAGMSLTLDELVLLVVTDGSNSAYFLPIPFISALIFVIIFSLYMLILIPRPRD